MPGHIDLFKKYKTKHLIETGTFQGQSIDAALQAGFSFVDSVEIFPEFYSKAVKKFFLEDRVKLHLGSSEDTFLTRAQSILNIL